MKTFRQWLEAVGDDEVDLASLPKNSSMDPTVSSPKTGQNPYSQLSPIVKDALAKVSPEIHELFMQVLEHHPELLSKLDAMFSQESPTLAILKLIRGYGFKYQRTGVYNRPA